MFGKFVRRFFCGNIKDCLFGLCLASRKGQRGSWHQLTATPGLSNLLKGAGFDGYRERGKHYLINSQKIFSGKVINYLTEINSYQVDSGNAMGNFHANLSTQTVGHPHSGVWGRCQTQMTLTRFGHVSQKELRRIWGSQTQHKLFSCWKFQNSFRNSKHAKQNAVGDCKAGKWSRKSRKPYRFSGHVKYTGIAGMFGWSRIYFGLVKQTVSSKRAPQFLWHFNISCISSVSPHVNRKHVDKGEKA